MQIKDQTVVSSNSTYMHDFDAFFPLLQAIMAFYRRSVKIGDAVGKRVMSMQVFFTCLRLALFTQKTFPGISQCSLGICSFTTSWTIVLDLHVV